MTVNDSTKRILDAAKARLASAKAVPQVIVSQPWQWGEAQMVADWRKTHQSKGKT